MALIAPAVFAAVIGFWSITVPSLWRDESVTAHFAREPFDTAWREWGEYDAVHAAHYLLVRLTIWIDPVELGVRLPSVIGLVAATLGIGLIGRRLSGTLTGTCAAMTYALLPVSSRYAQEGRSYALVSAVAVFASLALLRLLERPSWRRTAAYAGFVTALGLLHLYGLLLLTAHGLYVLLSARKMWVRMVVAWVAAGLVLAPLVLVSVGQRERQLFWITSPGWSELVEWGDLLGGTHSLGILLMMAAVAGAWFLRRAPLPLIWAILPVVASFAVSQLHPMFTARYVLFVVPALALLVGAGIVGIARALGNGRRPVTAAVVVVVFGAIAVLGLPTQREYRAQADRSEDLRSLTRTLTSSARATDVLMPVPSNFMPFVNAYGGAFERLEIVMAGAIPARVRRVWVINRGDPRRLEYLELRQLSRGFEPVAVESFGVTHLSLWTRR